MKASAVRNQIVETASRLFYKQGYNATGINQIIEEAGVAKASLYQHFHSKEDLLVEYLTVKGAETNAALKAEAEKFGAPKEKVLAVFDFLAEVSAQPEYYGCNFLNIVSELPVDSERVREIIRKQKDGVRAMFADILRPVHKEKLADELYMLFDGALITNKVHGNAWPIQTAKTLVEKIL
ncbi:TetR/AcrR family transcriptional regulator [Mucilaginibacter rubeus]|uniref:TetR/AcrR family transcriptional regulator n=1 Tax=Mucilaginibacter rubeus TaxID=2027860 RepID=A0AAE6MGG9_9SPHI|nr:MULTISPECIES: TetR/AcrR family transcriptional regulator [Mucilaginibacter]QEM02540.1 TetR/AcrR family transcriptional regulator [Mucilaginibacter rubeus]QEM15160.1 TetR/AcrR family transcriptional regulator [Mucilaginibacter gossypii]QTE42117.1 TetR/AcrR family transcriptional regulator [Mucilaginibacter rubeus]QTE48718.1 TetR/AcrR family transcriptional regulator [Mucilaginibacter rubeus]QTE53816.1 TetR/AcrR family transcriptional regulator [Mucilaginibacter rubeus]